MSALRNTPSPRGEGAGGGAKKSRCESAAEQKAWEALRLLRKEGIHVMRQLDVGRYRLDFAVRKARVAIEIDGELHNEPQRAKLDAKRQSILEHLGWRFVRIPAAMTHDSMFVLNAVRAAVPVAVPPPAPSPEGEGVRMRRTRANRNLPARRKT